MDIINGTDDYHSLLLGFGLPEDRAEEALKVMNASLTITDIARQISKDRGVSLKYAYELARKETSIGEAPKGWSKKEYILEALYRLNSMSGVRHDTLSSALKSMAVQINAQEITLLLWDLQKQQLVAFKESHGKSGSLLSRIRLTPQGRALIVEKRGTTEMPAVRVNAHAVTDRGFSGTNRQGAVHAVGRDGTNYRTHRKVAQGGPVEVVQPGHRPEIVPAPAYKPPKIGDPLPQNMTAPYPAPVIDEVQPGGTANAEAMEGKDASADTHTQYVMTGESYPHIVELFARREQREKDRKNAARMVEAAALISDLDPAEADVLMAKATEMEGKPLSRLEGEMLKLIDELTGSGHLRLD